MPITVDAVAAPLASAAFCFAAGWIGLALTARLLGRLPGVVGTLARRIADSVTPRFVRTAIAAVVGLGLGAGPATAAEDPLPRLDRVSSGQQLGVTPSAYPPATPPATSAADPAATAAADPTSPAADPTSRTAAASVDAAPVPYVVKRGDTLWAIAAKHLPPTATAADVDRTWRQWWLANRTVIGANPNLIRPGQELAQPESAAR